jgi:hypothetical protein
MSDRFKRRPEQARLQQYLEYLKFKDSYNPKEKQVIEDQFKEGVV